MPGRIQVKVIGLQKVEDALRHLPVGIRPLFERVAKYGQWRMKKHAKSSPAATGALAEGVDYDIRQVGSGPYALEAHIGFVGKGYGMRSSLGAIAPTVNYGRRPGKRPAVLAIRRWLRAYPLHVDPRATAARIGQRGTRGTYFAEKAADDLGAALPAMMRKTEAELLARWGKG